MYIGNDKTFGKITLNTFSLETGGEGYNNPLRVNTKDEGYIGTLYLTKEPNEYITYVEWCKETEPQGSGLKIELKEFINFLENQKP